MLGNVKEKQKLPLQSTYNWSYPWRRCFLQKSCWSTIAYFTKRWWRTRMWREFPPSSHFIGRLNTSPIHTLFVTSARFHSASYIICVLCSVWREKKNQFCRPVFWRNAKRVWFLVSVKFILPYRLILEKDTWAFKTGLKPKGRRRFCGFQGHFYPTMLFIEYFLLNLLPVCWTLTERIFVC